jgi:excisionase family DNA binding protein
MKTQPKGPGSGRPPPAPDAALLTTADVAALLRVHPKHVYRLFHRGLPRHRVGGEWRFRRDEVLAWAAGDASPAAAPRAMPPPPRLQRRHCRRGLLDAARADADAGVGAVRADRDTALALLRAGRALAIGYHGTSFPPSVPEGRLARLHLVRREVGLVASRGRPPRIGDVVGARLASRPPTAGVRATLDRALRSAGADPVATHRRARLYGSHLEVVGAVARGDADVGIATHAWARRLGLAFTALEAEDYGLLFFPGPPGRGGCGVRVAQGAEAARLAAAATMRDTGALRFDAARPRPVARAAAGAPRRRTRS